MNVESALRPVDGVLDRGPHGRVAARLQRGDRRVEVVRERLVGRAVETRDAGRDDVREADVVPADRDQQVVDARVADDRAHLLELRRQVGGPRRRLDALVATQDALGDRRAGARPREVRHGRVRVLQLHDPCRPRRRRVHRAVTAHVIPGGPRDHRVGAPLDEGLRVALAGGVGVAHDGDEAVHDLDVAVRGHRRAVGQHHGQLGRVDRLARHVDRVLAVARDLLGQALHLPLVLADRLVAGLRAAGVERDAPARRRVSARGRAGVDQAVVVGVARPLGHGPVDRGRGRRRAHGARLRLAVAVEGRRRRGELVLQRSGARMDHKRDRGHLVGRDGAEVARVLRCSCPGSRCSTRTWRCPR